MEETEKAYIAGFIDSDGCISITENQGGLKLVVEATQKDPSVIEWIQDRVGGSISKKWPKTSFKPRALYYQWALTGKRAQTFLEIIQPYLVRKRMQAELALEFPIMEPGHHPDKHQKEDRKMIHQAMRHHNSGGSVP